ncbi:hypothetical protein MEO94_32770, partial [Dolichospermum sp. ST_sed9]|nr:hypothetical protein [Dolichospermum sp. ST_sed9]
MSSSDWEKFLAEGKRAVEIVRRGLINRGINAGESRIIEFGTDEDIPVYSIDNQRQLFWVSVKSVSSLVENPRILSNWTKLITQKSGLKSLTGKELVNNQYVINSVVVLTYGLSRLDVW